MEKRMFSPSTLFLEEKREFGENVFTIVRARPDALGFPLPSQRVKERYRVQSIQELTDLYESIGETLDRLRLPNGQLPDVVLDPDYVEAVETRDFDSFPEDVQPPKVR